MLQDQARSSASSRRGVSLRNTLRHLAVATALLSVGACSTRSEFGYATLMNEVPATKAIIVPPPGGPAIVAVLQRNYKNGISQEISLATASSANGQNTIYVSMMNDPTALTETDDILSIPALRPDRLQAEMDERFPGIDMTPSVVYVQNRYGPFGFGTGRSASGDTCLYAWQRIEPTEAAIIATSGVISIRMRLCDADASDQQLLRSMYGFTISSYFMSKDWNPYGRPPSPPAHLGEPDAPLYPHSLMESGSTTSSSSATRTIVRTVSRPVRTVDKDTVLPAAAAPAPVSNVPENGFPIVPPPPGQ
jgi:hypothetical protein